MNTDTWLEERTIYSVIHGSHAYGTATEDSDVDIRGVCVPPIEYYFGYLNTFEQSVRHEPDTTIFGLRKFCKLAADGNPNALEILFVDEMSIAKSTKLGDELRDNRHLFISKKLKHTLSGYAFAQLKRIKSHRAWILNPPKKRPERADFGLPETTVIPRDQLATAEALIRGKVEEWDAAFSEVAGVLAEMRLASDEEYLAAGRTIGMSENFLELLARERAYTSAKRDWDSHVKWKATRNDKRYALEEKYGYDTKHGMHLVRLMRMCNEVLETGALLVRRPDAKELLEIRNGSWSYDKLVEYAESMQDRCNVLYKTSTLRNDPPRNEIDKLCIDLTRRLCPG